MAVRGRLKQGIRALTAFTRATDDALVDAYLSPAQADLFRRMSHAEQLHSINVLRGVLAQSATTPHDLAVAALLHDCGKARHRLAVWQKSLAVIVRKIAPRHYQRWSADDGGRSYWRRAFVVGAHHPRWGGEMVRSAGASDRAVWLIAHHADDPADHADHPHADLLRRLKQADDAH